MGVTPDLLERIRGEFREMPGMKLTIDQACRMWNLTGAQCRNAVDALIAEGFLRRMPSRAFIAMPLAARMVNISPQDVRGIRCSHCQHVNSIPADSIQGRIPLQTFRCGACGRITNAVSASGQTRQASESRHAKSAALRGELVGGFDVFQ